MSDVDVLAKGFSLPARPIAHLVCRPKNVPFAMAETGPVRMTALPYYPPLQCQTLDRPMWVVLSRSSWGGVWPKTVSYALSVNDC